MKLIDDPRARWRQLLNSTVQANDKGGMGHQFRAMPQGAGNITSNAPVRDWIFKEVEHVEVKGHPSYLSFFLSDQGEMGTVRHELDDSNFSERLCQQLNQKCKDKNMSMEQIGQLDLGL